VRDSGQLGVCNRRKPGGSSSKSGEPKTPQSHIPSRPSRGSRASQKHLGAGSLVTTHRSAPQLRPFPVPFFEPVPALAGFKNRKTKVPAAEPGGTFDSETTGSDATHLLPVRRIMNDAWYGDFPNTLLLSFYPLVFLEASIRPAAAPGSSLGILRLPFQPARVANTFTYPPCLAAPLRPGKEDTRASGPRPPQPPNDCSAHRGSEGLRMRGRVGRAQIIVPMSPGP
jgi:hypothetical protein